MANFEKVYTMVFADVYPLYVKKAGRRGRTQQEVDDIICWLTGYDLEGLARQLDNRVDFRTFYSEAPHFNRDAALIKGSICGHKVEEIEDGLMRKIRYLDKLIDELAKGKAIEKIMHR